MARMTGAGLSALGQGVGNIPGMGLEAIKILEYLDSLRAKQQQAGGEQRLGELLTERQPQIQMPTQQISLTEAGQSPLLPAEEQARTLPQSAFDVSQVPGEEPVTTPGPLVRSPLEAFGKLAAEGKGVSPKAATKFLTAAGQETRQDISKRVAETAGKKEAGVSTRFGFTHTRKAQEAIDRRLGKMEDNEIRWFAEQSKDWKRKADIEIAKGIFKLKSLSPKLRTVKVRGRDMSFEQAMKFFSPLFKNAFVAYRVAVDELDDKGTANAKNALSELNREYVNIGRDAGITLDPILSNPLVNLLDEYNAAGLGGGAGSDVFVPGAPAAGTTPAPAAGPGAGINIPPAPGAPSRTPAPGSAVTPGAPTTIPNPTGGTPIGASPFGQPKWPARGSTPPPKPANMSQRDYDTRVRLKMKIP